MLLSCLLKPCEVLCDPCMKIWALQGPKWLAAVYFSAFISHHFAPISSHFYLRTFARVEPSPRIALLLAFPLADSFSFTKFQLQFVFLGKPFPGHSVWSRALLSHCPLMGVFTSPHSHLKTQVSSKAPQFMHATYQGEGPNHSTSRWLRTACIVLGASCGGSWFRLRW